jgi:hypothetical protein
MKKTSIEVFFVFFELIVVINYPIVHLVKQAGRVQGRGTGFMANLYMFKTTEHESVSQGVNGLQPIHLEDVSTRPGCVHRVLRSTST